MSFRPKQNKIAHLTMEEVKGMMLAKEEARGTAALADQQLVTELQKRGFRVDK